MTCTLDGAVHVVVRLRDARTIHAFEHALGDFVRLLGGVPDAVVSEVSDEDVAVLRNLSEEVIDHIEAWVGRGTVHGVREQTLISRLYEIRRLLEEIHLWRRHFSSAGLS